MPLQRSYRERGTNLCMAPCSAFYERLKEVRDYHRRYPFLEVTEVRRCCLTSKYSGLPIVHCP